ncbi:MAG TPA: hypothetical protein VFW27_01480, partial [Actinoplanes sp.]|nr:hypothetical protein [Actinoplanes sp.]
VSEYAHGRPERYFAEIEDKISTLRRAGRQREDLEEVGDYLIRRAFFREDLDATELDEFRDAVELSGHIAGTRSALLATVLVHDPGSPQVKIALDRLRVLDMASTGRDTIGFRFSFAECCDAVVTGRRDRLVTLQREIGHMSFRSRSWIPVECFLESLGLPLPPVPTQIYQADRRARPGEINVGYTTEGSLIRSIPRRFRILNGVRPEWIEKSAFWLGEFQVSKPK